MSVGGNTASCFCRRLNVNLSVFVSTLFLPSTCVCLSAARARRSRAAIEADRVARKMAETLRSMGLSFKDTGFVKLNTWFPPMLAAAHFTVTSWCKSPISVSAIELLPVPMEKVPYFVIAIMPLLAILCAIIALEATSALAPTGYQSQAPRDQKDYPSDRKVGKLLPACDWSRICYRTT